MKDDSDIDWMLHAADALEEKFPEDAEQFRYQWRAMQSDVIIYTPEEIRKIKARRMGVENEDDLDDFDDIDD